MKAIFLRIIEAQDKGAVLSEVIANHESPLRFEVNPESFATVPRSPFAYWVSDRVRVTFARLVRFEADGRTAKQGIATADDFRFIRLWTETPLGMTRNRWFPFAKGGKFSPFFADLYLMVNWARRGAEIIAWGRGRPQNIEFFLRPGLTWPRRTQGGLSLRALPAGCIFADKGPATFVDGDEPGVLLALLAVANSRPFRALVDIQMAFGSYEVGVLQRTPVPELKGRDRIHLGTLARRGWSLKRSLDTRSETSHAFVLPALLQVEGTSLATRASAWASRVASVEAESAGIQREIDDICFSLYGIDGSDRQQIAAGFRGIEGASTPAEAEEDDEGEAEEIDATPLAASLVSWSIGVTFGRFDVRLGTGERQPPGEPKPFDQLPACSPGMLADDTDGPMSPPSGYSIRIPTDGILVDDPGFNGAQPHRDDIVRRVREVFDLLWKDKSHQIEQEACDILGVSDLRDYFRKPAGFFQDHLKRYSKSRRKAPIYWPLSTASGSYTIWLYYHRLNNQTLYGAVNKYVEPKIAEMERGLARIEDELKTASGRDAAKLTDRLNEARAFLGELRDMREELLRIAALPYKPDLNDGVIINAAPLHKLFRLRSWAKDTEDCWKTLEKGDYDWAHLAYTIWSDRVREVCRRDRSIAIAHGLEDLCEVEAPESKKKGGRGRRKKEAAR